MSVFDAFEQYQQVVNAPKEAVISARERRKLFEDALGNRDDVLEVVSSGSLARGTHKDPIHDVDLIVVYDESAHPDWGIAGASAADALGVTGATVNELLGATNGSHARAVRLASPRNHAVKCFLDDPKDENAFTVDVMPAFRREGKLFVPESANDQWVFTNPEYLIEQVKARHAEWNHFAGLVRMLKTWASAEHGIKIKSLVMEILALELMPVGSNRPAALAGFFTKAAWQIESGTVVEDPAKLCGPIQPDLDMTTFAERLQNAATIANKAIQAAANNNPDRAIKLWGEIFGTDFPLPASAGAGAAAATVGPRPIRDTPQG